MKMKMMKKVCFFWKIFLFTSVIFQKFKKVWKVQKVSFPKLWAEFWFLFFSFPFWVFSVKKNQKTKNNKLKTKNSPGVSESSLFELFKLFKLEKMQEIKRTKMFHYDFGNYCSLDRSCTCVFDLKTQLGLRFSTCGRMWSGNTFKFPIFTFCITRTQNLKIGN